MLVLSRCAGDVVFIGDDIQVRVISVTGGQVKIGIAAPAHVPVHREEIYRRLQAKSASGQGVSSLANPCADRVRRPLPR
jgi:carbon storage regulator